MTLSVVREKRRYARHPIHSPLSLDFERSDDRKTVETKDLSLGGLSFLWAKRLVKGRLLRLTIPVKEKLFEVVGRVAYSKEDRKTGRYRTGVFFTDPSSTFKAKLAEEALEILEFRKRISHELGHEVSEEEAANQWVLKYAADFAGFFEKTK